jgi:hypothetical protein
MGNVESRLAFPGGYLNIDQLTSHYTAGYEPVQGKVTLRIGGLAPYITDKLQIMLRGVQSVKYDEQ